MDTMVEIISKMLANNKFSAIKEMLSEMNIVDIAALIEEMEPENQVRLFRLLPKTSSADAFSYLPGDIQGNIVDAITNSELEFLMEDMFLDDAVDFLEEVPANVVTRVLAHTKPETRKLINKFLQYPDNSAGSIMTIEMVSFPETYTVKEAIEMIRKTALDKETIYTCYVCDSSRHLIGVTTVKELLLHDYDDVIDTFMETNTISLNTLDDQELAAQLFDKYDFLALPVVDMENRLVGIITVDDAIDVIQEENTEDIQKMNAMLPTEKSYLKTSVFESWRSRFPWLLLLMVSATFTGSIITSFEDKLASLTILTAFIPMLMDTGGNSGTQASTMVIRGLALDEIEPRDAARVWFKEIRVALLVSAGLALINFARIAIQYHDVAVAAIVSLTLIATVCIAKSLGCLLPMLAKKLKLDPALMATPILTTVTDAASILVYFTLTMNILGDRL